LFDRGDKRANVPSPVVASLTKERPMFSVQIPPEPVPKLTLDQVHVWLADLTVSASRQSVLAGYLSGDEIERARRFHFDTDRNRFICARGILRELLGAYTGRRPECFRFSYGAFGRPALEQGTTELPDFNVSHSGDVGLFAFTDGRAVGVDVERIDDDNECFFDIALQYYSGCERARLARLESADRRAEFYLCWTRREAFLKATGAGIGQLSSDLDLHVGVNYPAVGGGTAEWKLETIHMEGYAATVAAEGSRWSLTCFRAQETAPAVPGS
jgi:4'-phosphopantetheinyl transferase